METYGSTTRELLKKFAKGNPTVHLFSMNINETQVNSLCEIFGSYFQPLHIEIFITVTMIQTWES